MAEPSTAQTTNLFGISCGVNVIMHVPYKARTLETATLHIFVAQEEARTVKGITLQGLKYQQLKAGSREANTVWTSDFVESPSALQEGRWICELKNSPTKLSRSIG